MSSPETSSEPTTPRASPRRAPFSPPPSEIPPQPAGSPEIFFRTLAMPVVLALIALGFHFFLRGHNAPGGGFIAGLLVAAAALLARMARDLRLLRIRVEMLVPIGLLVALVTGVVPMMFGASFLTSDYGYLDWPLVGEFEWATAVAFDLGVFLVVIGTTITIIDLLADDRNLKELGPTVAEGAARQEGSPMESAGDESAAGDDDGDGDGYDDGDDDGDDDAANADADEADGADGAAGTGGARSAARDAAAASDDEADDALRADADADPRGARETSGGA